MELAICRQRGPQIEDNHWICKSNRLLHQGTVTEAICRQCPYVDMENLAVVPIGKAPETLKPRGQCSYRGEATGNLRDCPTCAGHVRKKEFACHHPAHRGNPVTIETECQVCPDHSEAVKPAPPASEQGLPFRVVKRWDKDNLFPKISHHRFNPSIIEYRDGYLLAFRNGWSGSQIFVAQLDKNFEPRGDYTELRLTHPAANYGREDPRLFRLNGHLHIMYIGVVGGRQLLHTNVLFARLNNDTFATEDVFHPSGFGRNLWEKNHSYFDHEGTLYAVYSIAPHQILKVEGNRADWAHHTATRALWKPGTEMRGSAPPVRVGDEYWHFFHSRVEKQGHRIYCIGLYTFEARPPFRVRRIIPDAIEWADPATKPRDQYASVVFAGGAVRVGDEWVLACGIHDRWSELHAFKHDDLERQLISVSPPSWWSCRLNGIDEDIFTEVVSNDVYRLGDRRFAPDDAILDVGSHVGSFAFAAWDRGARHIHCYEPFEASLDLLTINAQHMPSVRTFPDPVGDGNPLIINYPSPIYPEPSSMVWTRSVTLDTAIDRIGGRVKLLKIDCEGCEFPALFTSQCLGQVDEIVGEAHACNWQGRHWTMADLEELLTHQGFMVKSEKPGHTWLFWAKRL